MTETFGTFLRNAALATFAVVVAGALLRPQISSALVARGDQRLARASASAALPYYVRAMAFAPGDAAALDRFAFTAVLVRNGRSLRDAVTATSRYLDAHPSDDAIRVDRAFALRLLGDDAGAERDFAVAGAHASDPALLALAGYAALRIGDRHGARRLWRRALAFDPSYRPAAFALAKR